MNLVRNYIATGELDDDEMGVFDYEELIIEDVVARSIQAASGD